MALLRLLILVCLSLEPALALAARAQPSCANSYATLAGQRVRREYYVEGSQNKAVSFSYELEFTLPETPALLDFYKPIGFDETKWLALSQPERLRIAEEEVRKSVVTKTPVLERTSQAPDFLSATAVREAEGRVELAANAVEDSPVYTFRQLDWVWEKIGPASVQGHVAFPISNIRGAQNAIKLDFDLAQIEALSRGYERYLKDGTIPGKNLSHHSLAPLDQEAFLWMQKEMERKLPKSREKVNIQAKNIYGTSYRPDLYTKENIGFEIRNCHKRLDCLKDALVRYASRAESNFDSFRDLKNVGPLIGEKALQSLPTEAKRVLREAGQHIRALYPQYVLGGADPGLRFALPLLDWSKHPYLLALPKERRQALLPVLEREANAFRVKLVELDAQRLDGPKLVDALQVATAKWAHGSWLDTALRDGEVAFLEAKGLAPTQASAVPEIDVRRFSSLLDLASMQPVAKARFSSLAVNHQGKDNFAELSQLVKDATDRERMILAKNLELDEHFATYLNNIWKLGDQNLYRDLLFSKEGGDFARNLLQQKADDRSFLLAAVQHSGTRSTLEKPYGGVVRDVIADVDAAKLSEVIRASRQAGITPEEFATLLTKSGFLKSNFSREVANYSHLRELLVTGDPTPEGMSFLIKAFEGTPPEDQRLMIEAVVGLGENVRTTKSGLFLDIKGKEYYFQGTDETNAQFYLAKDMRPGPLAKARMEAREPGAVGKFHLGAFDLKAIVNDREGVYLVSSTLGTINHQRLLIGGKIYSMGGSSGVYVKQVTEKDIAKDRVIKLKASKDEFAQLQSQVESRVGKRVSWRAINPKPGEHNCTTWIACDLEDTGILKLPNAHLKGDAIGQSDYLIAGLGKLPEVEKVFVNGNYQKNRLAYNIVVKAVYGVIASPPLLMGYMLYRAVDDNFETKNTYEKRVLRSVSKDLLESHANANLAPSSRLRPADANRAPDEKLSWEYSYRLFQAEVRELKDRDYSVRQVKRLIESSGKSGRGNVFSDDDLKRLNFEVEEIFRGR